MSEGNVGARLLLIGKSAFLGGLKEVTAAVNAANKEMAASSKAATASQVAGYATLAEAQAAYRAKIAVTAAENSAALVAAGRKAAIGLGAVAAITVYEGLRIHSSFQSALLKTVNLAGISQSRLGALTAGIKGMSSAVNQGLTPLANALYRVASTPAGLKATNAQLLTMVKYSAELATIGGKGTDLEQTARIIGSAATVGVKGTGSPKNIVNLAAATVGSGDIKMSDFVSFMGTGVLTSGKLTGVTLPQMGAFLALAGSNLQSGQVSGHGLAHGLLMMSAPNITAGKAFGSVGLSPFALGDTMRNKGLGPAIHQLYNALSKPLGQKANTQQLTKYGFSQQDISQAQTIGMGKMGNHGQTLMTEILTRAFGGARMGIPLNMMVAENQQYDSTYKHIQKQMKGDIVDKAMARQLDTLSGKTGQFTKSLANLADTIGATLTPAVKVLLTMGTDLANLFAQHKLLALGLAGVITAVLGPAIGLYMVDRFKNASGAISRVLAGYKNLILGSAAEDTALATEDGFLTKNASLFGADAAAATADGKATGAASSSLLRFLGLAAIATGVSYEASKHLGPVYRAMNQVTSSLPGVTKYGPDGLPLGSPQSNYNLNGSHKNALTPSQVKRQIASLKSDISGVEHPGFWAQMDTHLGLGQSNAEIISKDKSNIAQYQRLLRDPHVHVYIDGKEVFAAIQNQTKKNAARNR